jgi:hypothetical protein
VYYLFDFDYSVGFNFYIGKLYLMSLVLLIFEFALPNLCGRDALHGVLRSSRGEAPNTPVIKKKKKKVFNLLTLKSEFLLISKNQIPLLAFKSMFKQIFFFPVIPSKFLYSLYPFPHPCPLSPLFYLFLLSKLTTTMEIGLWPWLKLYGPSSLAMEVEPLSSSMGMEVP